MVCALLRRSPMSERISVNRATSVWLWSTTSTFLSSLRTLTDWTHFLLTIFDGSTTFHDLTNRPAGIASACNEWPVAVPRLCWFYRGALPCGSSKSTDPVTWIRLDDQSFELGLSADKKSSWSWRVTGSDLGITMVCTWVVHPIVMVTAGMSPKSPCLSSRVKVNGGNSSVWPCGSVGMMSPCWIDLSPAWGMMHWSITQCSQPDSRPHYRAL